METCEDIAPVLKEVTKQTALLRYSIDAAVSKTPNVYENKIYLLISEHVLEGQRLMGDLSKKKKKKGW